MLPYELVYIIPARVKEPNQVKSSVLNIIKEKGGEIWAEINFGKRRLSYAIDHARNGEFVGVEFQADSSKVSEIKSALNIFDDIVRFQFSRIKKLSAKENFKTDILRSEPSIRPLFGETRPERPEAVKIEKIIRPDAPKEKEAETVSAPPPQPESEKSKPQKETKVSLEELDKKLEEILDEEVK